MTNHHDTFFKQVFSDRANTIDFSKHTLRKTLSANLDYESFRLENVSYVDEHLAEYFSDVVYTCNYGKLKIRISLLFEHKSYPDKNISRQLLKYILGIWDYNEKQNRQLTPVIPIVLYHGGRPWHPNGIAELFPDLPKELSLFIPDFEFIFIDLSTYSEQEIKQRIFDQVSLKISLLVMKNIFNPEKLEQQLPSLFNIGAEFYREQSGLKFLETVVTYLYQATEIETAKIINAIEPISNEGGKIAMSTAEKLRQEGRAEERKENLRSFVHRAGKQGIPIETIAKIVELDSNLIEQILNNKNIEIPLNLLEKNN